VLIINKCDYDLQPAYQTNGKSRGKMLSMIAANGNYSLPVSDTWAGRVWARRGCDIHDCELAGAANPASLAEFKMSGANDIDYYDVSFVDGYNLPMRIEPLHRTHKKTADDPHHCSATFCSNIPKCPKDLQHRDKDDSFVGCQSACSRYQKDQYCCTGDHNTPETCHSNHFARAVKKICPDVYTYPYDDASSVYGCKAQTYTVTFC
ncbi:thaumatin, partial [Syncephalastrum racemosum]